MKLLLLTLLIPFTIKAQVNWKNVDSLYQPLPKTVHIYFTNEPIDTGVFKAFYLVADLKDKGLDYTTDTTLNRRLSPSQFYAKNEQPLVVVNGTFFSFETNRNLNVVIRDGKVLSSNAFVKGKGKDSIKLVRSYYGAIGINKRRKADVAWIRSDSTIQYCEAVQSSDLLRGSFFTVPRDGSKGKSWDAYERWRVRTAIGGGPVLLQNGDIRITNEEEWKFTGKAINDKHPRTAMGYTRDHKLIILVVEGRNPKAGGATLGQEAQILKDLGCVEALNLDGGGSSCLLVNGRETIRPSDKEGQRPVPAVFIIRGTK